jgi:phage shock protein E
VKKIIVDVRETGEFAMGHANGAINIPMSTLPGGLDKLQGVSKEEDEIVLYCRSGGRAGNCIKVFQNMGYKHVVNGINKDHVELHHN